MGKFHEYQRCHPDSKFRNHQASPHGSVRTGRLRLEKLRISHIVSQKRLVVEASYCNKNDRYQAIRHAVDDRVIEGYRLWKNNYIAYDMVNHSYKYSDLYTPEDVEKFTNYVEQQLDKVEKSLNRSDLRDIFLKIYGNPVLSKEQLMEEKAAAAKQQ